MPGARIARIVWEKATKFLIEQGDGERKMPVLRTGHQLDYMGFEGLLRPDLGLCIVAKGFRII